MPDDNRLDLSMDIEKVGDDLLADVKKATEEVKSRKASDKAKEAKAAEKEKSRRLSAIIIAVGAVVLLLIAYFVVFAKPEPPASGVSGAQSQSPAPAIKAPVAPSSAPKVQVVTPNTTRRSGRNSQVVGHPSDDYEQPGM